MDGVPILAQLVDHLQAVGSPVGIHKGNREGSCQGGRPIRDGERLLQGEEAQSLKLPEPEDPHHL